MLAEAWPAPVTRDRLIALIWPDNPEAGARRLLTQSLYALKRDLGDVVTGAGRDIVLDPAAIRVDLLEARRALRSGDLEGAMTLQRGALFDGFHLRGSGEFDRWADGVRAENDRQVQRALETLITRHSGNGQDREAARWGDRLVQGAPYDAGAVLQCMTLWERAGDPAAALAAAAAYEMRMRDDLELAPDARVLERASALGARVSPADAAARVSPARGRARGDAASPTVAATAAVQLQPRRSRLPAFAVVVLLAVLGAAGAFLVRRPVAEDAVAASSRSRDVVVLTFDASGTAAPAGAGATVSQMLASTLDGSGGSRVILADSASREEEAAAGLTLVGTLVSSAGQVRLDARLRAGTDSIVARGSVSGPADSLIALVERLALQLVPSFYDVPAAGEMVLGRYRSARTLRLHLDGETALRRGAFDEAQAAFRAAVELDSSLAWSWYRRAVAADLSHSAQDADRAMVRAASPAAVLTERQRTLVRAYGRWRVGDAREAEPLYRQLIAAETNDREAWTQFAEVAYHGWPLHGRPIDAARDAWSRVVALDSSNVPALVHAIRLGARARDTAAVRAMLARAAAVRAGEPGFSESRFIAALASGHGTASPEVKRMMATLPAYSLYFLHWVVAGMLEAPREGTEIAAQLTLPSHPASVRAEGHVALAHLAAARGQFRRARAEIALASRLDPAAAAWSRAYLATLPFLPPSSLELEESQQQLAGAPRDAAAAPLYLQLAVEAPAAAVIEDYLRSLLALGLFDSGSGGRTGLACGMELPTITRELCADLALGLRAERQRRRGSGAGALAELEKLRMMVPYQYAGRSAYFARTRERFVRAQLLEGAGRLEEAYSWYAAVPHGSRLDYLYLAPSHLARGRIRERAGDLAIAAQHYRAARDLWRNADAELAVLTRQAEEGLKRTSAPVRPVSR